MDVRLWQDQTRVWEPYARHSREIVKIATN